MPNSTSLAAYFFSLKDVSRHINVDLRTFNIQGKNIFQLFTDFLETRQARSVNDAIEQKVLRVRQFDNQSVHRLISGIIETGAYGYAAEFYNIEEEQTLEIRRRPSDAEMIPFYFLISLPDDQAEGIIIFQKFINFGIKTVVKNDLETYFRGFNENLRVMMNPIFYQSVIEDFQRGEMKSIRIIKYVMPRNIEDVYQQRQLDPKEAYLEFAIKSRKKRSLNLYSADILGYLRSLITERPTPLNTLIQIPQMPDYDTIKVDLKINGKTKVLNLVNPFGSAPLYDITNEVVFDDGHPSYISINAIAQEYLESLEADRGIE